MLHKLFSAVHGVFTAFKIFTINILFQYICVASYETVKCYFSFRDVNDSMK